MNKIIAFIWAYALVHPGVNALRTPAYPEMINIIEKCINVNTYDRYDNVLQIMNDISSINTHLDWYYNKENEEKLK